MAGTPTALSQRQRRGCSGQVASFGAALTCWDLSARAVSMSQRRGRVCFRHGRASRGHVRGLTPAMGVSPMAEAVVVSAKWTPLTSGGGGSAEAPAEVERARQAAEEEEGEGR